MGAISQHLVYAAAFAAHSGLYFLGAVDVANQVSDERPHGIDVQVVLTFLFGGSEFVLMSHSRHEPYSQRKVLNDSAYPGVAGWSEI